MPRRWLQVKGDPSVRAFLCQQARQASLFDEHLDRVHWIVHALATKKGACHVKAHYPSSQLTCWFYDDPHNDEVYVKEAVSDHGILDSFPGLSYEGRQPQLGQHQLRPVLG